MTCVGTAETDPERATALLRLRLTIWVSVRLAEKDRSRFWWRWLRGRHAAGGREEDSVSSRIRRSRGAE